MSTINLFTDAFTNKYETFRATEPKPIKDIVPADFENAVIYVDGFKRDKDYILKGGELCTIRLYPKGGRSPSWWVATVLTVGVYAVADGITRAVTGKSIFSNVKAGLVKWMTGDTPAAGGGGSEQKDIEKIPQLRGAKNQSGYDRPYPLVLGKHLYTPLYVGKPYTTLGGTDGEDQYFHALFLLGYKELKVSNIKIGEIDLASNTSDVRNGFIPIDGYAGFLANNPQLELQQGANEVSLYPQKVVEEQLSIELLNAAGDALHVTRFSAKNPQKVQIEFTFDGLLSYDTAGTRIDAAVNIRIEWRESGVAEWKEFGPIAGCSSYDSASRTSSFVRQKSKVMRFIAERQFQKVEVINIPGRVIEIRVIRTNPQADDGRTSDISYLSALRTWCFDYEASKPDSVTELVPQVPMIAKDRDRTCRLGFRMKADDALSGMIDAINCIVQSCCRTWTGSAWSTTEAPTQNPAAIALKILQSPMLGEKAYPDEKLDLDSFGDFHEWCDQTITDPLGAAHKRFSCNGVVTAEKRLDEILNTILSTGRGMRVLHGSRYGILIDKPRETPVTIINNQNVLEATNQKEFSDLPDGYKVKFVDETDGYQENELFAMHNPLTDKSVIENIDMPFVTSASQVYRNAMYQLACRYLRPEIWNRKLSSDGALLNIGDLVEVQDDTIVVGIGEGAEIQGFETSGNFITKILTDGQFEIEDATKTYAIKIAQFDGENAHAIRTSPVILSEPGVYNSFELAVPIGLDETPVPSVGDIISFGEYQKEVIDAICFGKKDNADGTFDITLVPYAQGVYTADSGEIPDFDSKVTAPPENRPVPARPPAAQNTYDKIEQIYVDNSKRPTYEEIVNGFTESGATVLPNRLSVTAAGGFRSVILQWSKQAYLSNLKEYQVQVSEDGEDWFAPRFDGSDWKGEYGEAFVTAATMLVHPNIPPAGTVEEPEGRFLFYRVRQFTMRDVYSEWSTIVGAQTKLTDTGDYAVNSISANALKVVELFSLFATIGDTLVVDPAGLSSEKTDGDTKAILNSREIAFQYFLNGLWQTMARLGIEGVEASQLFSKDKLYLTNDDMTGRRTHGYDIGIPYLSDNSRVAHFDVPSEIQDNKVKDQKGEDFFNISGSGAFVGDEDGIPLILKAVAPYATEAKALAGEFRLQKNIGLAEQYTVDFWMYYQWNENQVVFRVGTDTEYLQMEVLNEEPYFNDEKTDAVELNDEATDEVWLNEIEEAQTRIARYNNGNWYYTVIKDDEGNPGFAPGQWYHIAVVDMGNQVQVLLNDKVFPFSSQPPAGDVVIDINPTSSLILIDELMVDAATAESIPQFQQNNNKRVPWGSLDDSSPWAIFHVKNPEYFKTNIFQSPDFTAAVKSVINE